MRDIVLKFINKYNTKDNILGIIFYGSSKYKTNTIQSDIDLLFITDGDKNYKGTTYIDGKRVEYFEKNIYYLIEKLEELQFSFDRSLVSIFKNGEVIYSNNGVVEYLKEEILSSKEYFPQKRKYKMNDKSSIGLFEYINSIQLNDSFFEYIYYNLLEFVRKKYHEENGFSKIPSMKISKLYSNPMYAKEIYCVTLPDQRFRDLYLDLMINGYQEDKLDFICSLICVRFNDSKVKNYSRVELKYLSTIINNMVDKTVYYLKQDEDCALSCYYITLDKIRRLYCYMNRISPDFNLFDEDYDIKFIELFNLCINDDMREQNLKELFDYVVQSLDMDYNNYKILELV